MTLQQVEFVPALFMHIQKTAGTSIVQMAAKHYGKDNVCSHGDFVGKSLQEMVRFPFVSGHFGHTLAKPLMHDRYSFTFLRDPVERVLSYYSFCRSRDPTEFHMYQDAQSLGLKDFLQAALSDKKMKWPIYNGQTWYLACGPGDEKTRVNFMPPSELLEMALAHLHEYSYVGFTETFTEDVDNVFRELNVRHVGTKEYINASPGREIVENISEDVLELIKEITQLDAELYNTALRTRKPPLIATE